LTWIASIDAAIFRWINQGLGNPFFDWLMPVCSGNVVFVPALAVLAACLWWKGGVRIRVCLSLTAIILPFGDSMVSNTLKKTIGRERPFAAVQDAVVRVGRGGSKSMPSSHAFNWFAAAAILSVYSRRTRPWMYSMASVVAFSRVYNGVHYPSDVLAGAFAGTAYGFAGLWGLQRLWHSAASRWFPLWHARMPSLLDPEARLPQAMRDEVSTGETSQKAAGRTVDPAVESRQWLRAGYLLIGIVLAARLGFLAAGTIQLSEDEAYQWTWSKHMDWSYYSKPPLIAATQYAGTHLWGDTAFGVRFFSPVISAVLAFILLRFLAREVNSKAGFAVVLASLSAPLLSAGGVLMTVDPLSVLFWTAAMLSGWRAVHDPGNRAWLWTGLWLGLGFLSKYTGLCQLVCFAVFFALWKPARRSLKTAGPWLALGVLLLCAMPVLAWNYHHGWITVSHVAADGGYFRSWQPTLRFFRDFVLSEFGLLNPVFFIGMIWASAAMWAQKPRDERLVYFFSMGAPLFIGYTLFTFRSRVLPNWIVPSVVPLFCLMAVYWQARWKTAPAWTRKVFAGGVFVGLLAVLLLHETNWIGKIAGIALPPKIDPLRRVRAWDETARIVNEARLKLQEEGKPVVILCDHYGMTGQMSFYIDDARRRVQTDPLVYFRTSDHPENQYFFWPGYAGRKGCNAIFVQESKTGIAPPESLVRQFASVRKLGVREALYRGRVFRSLHLYECRDLQ
jgi:membrane-associated phospholipid phosphatase